MKKESNYIKIFFACLLTVLSTVLPLSCIYEKFETIDPVDILLHVRFSMEDPVTRATDEGTAGERKVTTLRIFAFDERGRLDVMEYASESTGLTGNPFQIETAVRPGDVTFILIGNEPPALTTTLQNITRREDLAGLVLNESPASYNATGKLLPFVTEVELPILRDHPVPVEITLKRAISKSQVSIRKEVNNYDNVELVSLQLVDTPEKSALLPGADFNTLPHLAARNVETFGITLSDNTENMSDHYLYEHYTGTGDAVSNNATRIKAVLKINNVSKEYHIPFRITDEQGVVRNDVGRNILYRTLLTVYTHSIVVQYTVLHWSDQGIWDKEAGAHDSNTTISHWTEEVINKGTEEDNKQVGDWDDEDEYEKELPEQSEI